jgi:L-ascorbate metabolism protein UlaG (beta-lactamase superfamily)
MNALSWLGHSTVLIELDGTRVLTDPLLRARVAHLRRAQPLGADALGRIDAVLLSHAHWDHLDLPSLVRLGRDTPIVVPRGSGKLLSRNRFTDVTEVDVGDEVRIGEVVVRATRADHDGARTPLHRNAVAVGFLVEGSQAVYFAGDSDVFDEMKELHPSLDVALVPIWGWGPSLGPGHMGPSEAAEAVALLRPRIAVPIHWGTYYPAHIGRKRATFLHTPAETFVSAAHEHAPDTRIEVLAPGDRLALV